MFVPVWFTFANTRSNLYVFNLGKKCYKTYGGIIYGWKRHKLDLCILTWIYLRINKNRPKSILQNENTLYSLFTLSNTHKTVSNIFLGYISMCVMFKNRLGGFVLHPCWSLSHNWGQTQIYTMLYSFIKNKSRFRENIRNR